MPVIQRKPHIHNFAVGMQEDFTVIHTHSETAGFYF